MSTLPPELPADVTMVADGGLDSVDTGAASSQQASVVAAAAADNSSVPKTKRLACMICRRRKLKCDGQKPSCSTCTRLGHDCAYDEVRRKSGPKRGYVKALEERLKQVETLLKTQENALPAGPPAEPTSSTSPKSAGGARQTVQGTPVTEQLRENTDPWHYTPDSPPQPDEFGFNNGMPMNMDEVGSGNFSWEMIRLGLEEPLPSQETIDELHQIYFEKIHPSIPMIHKYRYLAAMNLAQNKRPPVCLRYAIWTLACSAADKYDGLKELYYRRARKYVEADYVKGFGEHIICVAHAQTHTLLAAYELKMMYFPRAWMSSGSAVRLSQMVGLHRLDSDRLDVKECLPKTRDWTELEERRRTFWMTFSQDRYASIGTGWPMAIDERDITTKMPASEEAFEMSRPEQTMTLSEAMTPAGVAKLSSFGGTVLMACLFGWNLNHLHRPKSDDNEQDLNGEFWKRHRAMDNILLNTSLSLPQHLKLPGGLQIPNVVYTNMCIHTSTICLHQAAISKAEKNGLPANVSNESKMRCISAANEIASIMRMVSHMDLSAMNPFLSFCLYVASRVFVQYLKGMPDDSQSADSLCFLLAAMNALKRKYPLTESFLVQLDLDIEALTTRIPKLKGQFKRNGDNPIFGKDVGSAKNAGAKCEEGAGNKGIFAYKTDLFSFKPRPDKTEATPQNAGLGLGNVDGNGGRTWVNTADMQMLGETRGIENKSSTAAPVPGISLTPTSPQLYNNLGNNESLDSSTNAESNQATPNSGCCTPGDQQQQQQQQQQLQQQQQVFFGLGAARSFFGMADGGVNALDGFAIGPDWGMATSGQAEGQQQTTTTGIASGEDGMLRNIAQIAPMETMDFGWDTNPPNM